VRWNRSDKIPTTLTGHVVADDAAIPMTTIYQCNNNIILLARPSQQPLPPLSLTHTHAHTHSRQHEAQTVEKWVVYSFLAYCDITIVTLKLLSSLLQVSNFRIVLQVIAGCDTWKEQFGILTKNSFSSWANLWQKPRTGLNFINVLRTASTLVDPKSVKRHWWLNCIYYAFEIYERKSCT